MCITYNAQKSVRAKVEPTERSIPPETITIVMPMAMTVITAVCRATLARLPDERNLGSSTAMITHSPIKLAKGMKRLIQSDINLLYGVRWQA